MNPQIETILKELVEATNSEAMFWSEDSKNPFPTETTKKYFSLSNDNQTKFLIDIDLTDNFDGIKWRNGIWIFNDKLTNGRTYIPTNDYIKKIEDYIFENEIKPNILAKDQSLILGQIANTIGSKDYRREKSIKSITNSDEGDLC
jgi:hypothetical protein